MTEQQAIKILWDYHHVHHALTPADFIFVLGSNDTRVAAYAAELFKKKLALLLLFSGGSGRFTGEWSQSEADLFAETAIAEGVPARCILIENKSTNTGENVQFSRKLLAEKGLRENPSLIAVQKPYMERRTLATLEAQWPQASIQVTSPPLSFDDYLTPHLNAGLVIPAIVGDFHRILEYPKHGFATPQPVTEEALQAFRLLIKAGYDSQLIKEAPIP